MSATPNNNHRRAKPKKVTKKNHCFSVYYHAKDRWELELMEVLRKRKKRKSIGSLFRAISRIALRDNGLIDKDGNSTVKGIGPVKKEKKRILKRTTTLAL